MSNVEFKKLFVNELQNVFNAEQQIVEALPKVINAVESPDLKEAFTKHYEESKQQVQRIERIFSQIEETKRNEVCESMRCLIQETEQCINSYPMSMIRDAAIIAAAQRIEHYEIAVYGTLRTFAKQLDFDNAVDLLDETLKEEKGADEILSRIATGGFFTSGINKKALKS